MKTREISLTKARLSDTHQLVIGNKVVFLTIEELKRLKEIINSYGS